jgi:hypothetical protein
VSLPECLNIRSKTWVWQPNCLSQGLCIARRWYHSLTVSQTHANSTATLQAVRSHAAPMHINIDTQRCCQHSEILVCSINLSDMPHPTKVPKSTCVQAKGSFQNPSVSPAVTNKLPLLKLTWQECCHSFQRIKLNKSTVCKQDKPYCQ